MSGNRFTGAFGRDMAVDLGTANTLVYVRGRGIVLNEPSVVAVNSRDDRLLAVGVEAKRMIGRTPGHIHSIRPLRDGVIADFDLCEKMLAYFIRRARPSRRLAKPRMVICVPSGITAVEQRAVQEVAESAGARKPAFIIDEPMAAAIGAGLPVHEPTGNMVVDIGGGTTEVAVISLGGIVTSQSVRIGGDEMDEAIVQFIKKEYSLAIGERTAEEIKIALGSACPLQEECYAEIGGRDLVTGLPKTIVTSTEEIRDAIEEPVSAIVDAVKATLDKTPPELAADIMVQGIVLTGGGALLHGLDARSGRRDRYGHRQSPTTRLLGRHRGRPMPGRVRSPQRGPAFALGGPLICGLPSSPGGAVATGMRCRLTGAPLRTSSPGRVPASTRGCVVQAHVGSSSPLIGDLLRILGEALEGLICGFVADVAPGVVVLRPCSGRYDIEEDAHKRNLRGVFQSCGDGQYEIRTVRPVD